MRVKYFKYSKRYIKGCGTGIDMTVTELIYTLSQAAEKCKVNRVTLWRSIKSGQLRSFTTPGGHYRIRHDDLQDFIAERSLLPSVQGDPKGKKVLIVDDEASIRKMLAGFLTKGGYQVEAAADGFEAGIKLARFKPDLILLDLNTPTLDGFEVCRRLKEDAATRRIRIVVFNGSATPENQARVLGLGVDAFLPQPVDPSTLMTAIGKFV